MNPEEFFKSLQKKPYETRVRILWSVVGIAAIMIFILWLMSLRGSLGNLNSQDLNLNPSNQPTAKASSYGEVERAELTTDSLKIYFNFNNSTDDILNLPQANTITLSINGQSLHPSQILNRQGQPFVQKVLSRTQNFGVLVFPKTNATSGNLTFDQMFFEQHPDQLLMQTFQLDLKELEKRTELRT